MYGIEAMLLKEKERFRVRAVQMDRWMWLLGIRRMDRVPNACTRELFGVKNGLDERINEGVLQCFSHVERVERDRIAKRVYVRVCW